MALCLEINFSVSRSIALRIVSELAIVKCFGWRCLEKGTFPSQQVFGYLLAVVLDCSATLCDLIAVANVLPHGLY